MRESFYLPRLLIERANIQRWMPSLAMFVRMKGLYKNCTHYGFTVRSLAKRMQCSPTSLHKHLRILRDQNLIVERDGNMTFVGSKTVKRLLGNCRSKKVLTDKRKVKTSLEYALLHDNLEQQQHAIDSRSDKPNVHGRNAPCEMNAVKSKFKTAYVGLSGTGISNLYVSNYGDNMHVHKTTAYRRKRKMAELGMISVSHKLEIVERNACMSKLRYRLALGDKGLFLLKRSGTIVRRRHDQIIACMN